MNRLTGASLLISFALSLIAALAQGAYKVGQEVFFRDDSNNYGGGYVKAKITADYGSNAAEQFMVQVPGARGEDHARFGQLRPADGSPRPPWPSNDPQRISQINNYKAVDYEPPGGPPNSAPAKPQSVPVNEPAKDMRKGILTGPGTHVPYPVGHPMNPVKGAGGPVPGQAAVLGKGLFPNGEPMGIPGQTNFKNNRSGQKSIVCVAPPGNESFIGRWNLKAGGAFTLKDRHSNYDGSQTTTWDYSFPVDADVLVINPGGTWYKQFAGKKVNGKWLDLGQNVVQLVGFEEDDWTGSVIKGQMEIRGPLGTWEYGKRF